MLGSVKVGNPSVIPFLSYSVLSLSLFCFFRSMVQYLNRRRRRHTQRKKTCPYRRSLFTLTPIMNPLRIDLKKSRSATATAAVTIPIWTPCHNMDIDKEKNSISIAPNAVHYIAYWKWSASAADAPYLLLLPLHLHTLLLSVTVINLLFIHKCPCMHSLYY